VTIYDAGDVGGLVGFTRLACGQGPVGNSPVAVTTSRRAQRLEKEAT